MAASDSPSSPRSGQSSAPSRAPATSAQPLAPTDLPVPAPAALPPEGHRSPLPPLPTPSPSRRRGMSRHIRLPDPQPGPHTMALDSLAAALSPMANAPHRPSPLSRETSSALPDLNSYQHPPHGATAVTPGSTVAAGRHGGSGGGGETTRSRRPRPPLSSTATEFRRALPQYPPMRYTYYQNQSPLPSPSSSMLSFSPQLDIHTPVHDDPYRSPDDGWPAPPLTATTGTFSDAYFSPAFPAAGGVMMRNRRSSSQLPHPGSRAHSVHSQLSPHPSSSARRTSFEPGALVPPHHHGSPHPSSFHRPAPNYNNRSTSSLERTESSPLHGARRNSASLLLPQAPLPRGTYRAHPYDAPIRPVAPEGWRPRRLSQRPSPLPSTAMHLDHSPLVSPVHLPTINQIPHTAAPPNASGRAGRRPSISSYRINTPAHPETAPDQIAMAPSPPRPHHEPPPALTNRGAPMPSLSMRRRQPPPRPLDARALPLPIPPHGGPPDFHGYYQSLPNSPNMQVDPTVPPTATTPQAPSLPPHALQSYAPSPSPLGLSPRHAPPSQQQQQPHHFYHHRSSFSGAESAGMPPSSAGPPGMRVRRESSYHPSSHYNGSQLYSPQPHQQHYPSARHHSLISPHNHHPNKATHPASSPYSPLDPIGLQHPPSNKTPRHGAHPSPMYFDPYPDRYPELSLAVVSDLCCRAKASQGRFENLAGLVENIFSSRVRLGKSFGQRDPDHRTQCPVNVPHVQQAFTLLLTQCPSVVLRSMGAGLTALVKELVTLSDLNALDVNAMFIAFLCPLLGNAAKYPDLLPNLCQVILGLANATRQALCQYFTAAQNSQTSKNTTATPRDSTQETKSVPMAAPTANSSTSSTVFTDPLDHRRSSPGTPMAIDSPLQPLTPATAHHFPIAASSLVDTGSTHPRTATLAAILRIFQQYISTRVRAVKAEKATFAPNMDEHIIKVTKCLAILYDLNEQNQLLPFTDFYNETLNENLEIKDDFPKFKSKEGFSFCNYPFILNPAMKSDILKIENVINMRQELQDAFFRALFMGVNSPYLVLEIRRSHIVRDAMCQLTNKTSNERRKQLKVRFVGEDAIDEGGVQKEFFQLVVREMFAEQYGMYEFNEESRLCWFTRSADDDGATLEEHRLMGSLIGLAIYNSVILDVHFPLALYKKLMGQPVGLADLADLDPTVARSLRQILAYESEGGGDDLEDVFGQTFQITYTCYGQTHHHDLKPNGDQIPLTQSNRQEFVDRYVDFLLNVSVSQQFEAFKEGFHSVCIGSAIKLFRPEELEQLICGSSDLDFRALELVTAYDGGFSANTPVIRYFWEVAHELTLEQKKRLLFFATGSDRVPIGGLGKLQFVITKNGTNSDRLPTSHTCFNVLLLCEYDSKAKLKERLLTAIGNAEGFGML
ncbi:hypothetical protein H4R34_001251 [Dimargaris verticillata]|uniref:HECT-type E3 ubiquitin transferase n=1 Tax=Dimargaris verticillata TaxID=2761393 RepID=A0A9W8BBS9_9FUNG|nr:hypothetical protein H4R34_001251 [Dimargaris verticillata]